MGPYACKTTQEELATAVRIANDRRYLFLGWGHVSVMIGYDKEEKNR